MKRFYITFGSAHLCGFGLHYYFVLDAVDEMAAQMAANQMTNGKWSGIYTETPNNGEKCLGYAIAERSSHDPNLFYIETRREDWNS